MNRFKLKIFISLFILCLCSVSAMAKENTMERGSVFIEAESAKLKTYCVVKNDSNASEKKTLKFGDEKNRELHNAASSRSEAIVYNYTLDHASELYVWVRAKSSSDRSKMWISTNGTEFTSFTVEGKNEYKWTLATEMYKLPGEHTISLLPYEWGAEVDEILVTRKTGTPVGFSEIDDTVKMDFEISSTTSWDERDDGVGRTYLQSKVEWQIPDIKPFEGHPRIFFRKEDIPKILENAQKPQNKSAWEMHLQYAQTDVEKLSLEMFEAKALDYALRGNKAAGERVVSEAMQFYEKYGRAYATSSGDSYNIIGQAIYTLAAVYDWCYDLLDENEKDYLIDQMIMLGGHLEMGWPPIKQNAFTTHGAEAQLQRDYLAMAIAVYDERPDIYNFVAARLFNEYVPYRKCIYQGHTYNMGTLYTKYRLKWDMLCVFLADKALGIKEIYGPDLRHVFYRLIYTYRPDGFSFHEGDISSITYNLDAKVERESWLASSYWNDPYLKQAYLENNGNLKFSWRTASNNVNITTSEWLLLNNPDLDGRSLRELPLSKYFPSPTGNMTARTSWEEGLLSPAVVCDMKIEEYTFDGHDHADSGSFLLYYKGYLARESGVYKSTSGGSNRENDGSSLWGGRHHVNFYRRAIAHNCMRVIDPNEIFENATNYVRYEEPYFYDELSNDGGQRLTGKNNNGEGLIRIEDVQNDEFKTGEVLGHEFGENQLEPNYTYLKGDLSYAYSDKIDDYERSFMFLNHKNEEHPATLIVFDRVKSSDKSFQKIWQLYGPSYPEISGSRIVFKDVRNEQDGFAYNGKMTVDALMPAHDNINFKVVGGDGNWALVDGIDYSAKMPASGYRDEYQNWRLEVSPKSESELDYFLNVIQVGDADGEEAYDVTPIETQKLAGCVISDRVVLFGKYRDRTKEDVSFSFIGEGKFEITVADMYAGTWEIWHNGKYLCDASASTDGGVVVFPGECGEYTLHYKNDNVKTFAPATIEELSRLTIQFNGLPFYTEKLSYVNDETVMIPARAILEKIGANVTFDSVRNLMIVDYKGQKYAFADKSAVVNSGENLEEYYIKLDSECINSGGYMMMPVDALWKCFGIDNSIEMFSDIITITHSESENVSILSNYQIKNENEFKIYEFDDLTYISTIAASGTFGKKDTLEYSYDGVEWFAIENINVGDKKFDGTRLNQYCTYLKIDSGIDVKFYGTKYNSDYEKIFDVTWSAENNANETGIQAIDNNLSTLWSSEGDYHWLTFDFYAPCEIQSAEIAWNNGTIRKAYFEIVGSNDGENWEYILKDAAASGTTADFEEFKFNKSVKYRYVKLLMYGNSVSKWNGVKEIRFKKADIGR